MKYSAFICVTADNLFQEEEKLNNLMETHVFVRNEGDSIALEPICKNEWGSRYDIYGVSKQVPIAEMPEELREFLPRVGDWHDVSLFEEEED